MIFMQSEPNTSSSSVVYESDTGSEDRPSKFTGIQANFQIARPAPKFSLRLGPKLLLQIQQLAQNHRPVPVLEIWQPPFCKSKLTREFRQGVKLRSGDVYATLVESYITRSTRRKDSSNSEQQSDSDNTTVHRDIIAAMCHDEACSVIHFRDARCSWRANARMMGPNQSIKCYRFTMTDQNRDSADPGRMILQWEKRGKENTPAGSVDAERFVLLLIDRKVRKKCRIATMTTGGLDIVVRNNSILDILKSCFDLMEPVDSEGRDSSKALEAWLYTLTLTLGILVGYKEGWLS